jgi:hypothetical protein
MFEQPSDSILLLIADDTEKPVSVVQAGYQVLATYPQTGETSARETRKVGRGAEYE